MPSEWVSACGCTEGTHFAYPKARAVCWRSRGFLLVAVLFLTVYPIANSHAPHTGSDDDDACNVGVTSLLEGKSPYSERTYLGDVLHQLPGALVLAAPFVLLGTSGLQNLFWLPAFFAAIAKVTKDSRMATQLFVLVVGLSPTVLHQVLTGTGHVSNAIYVALGLFWLIRKQRALHAIAWGIAPASRPNFLLLIPLANGYVPHTSLLPSRSLEFRPARGDESGLAI
jgi:hypothetical protein